MFRIICCCRSLAARLIAVASPARSTPVARPHLGAQKPIEMHVLQNIIRAGTCSSRFMHFRWLNRIVLFKLLPLCAETYYFKIGSLTALKTEQRNFHLHTCTHRIMYTSARRLIFTWKAPILWHDTRNGQRQIYS